MSKQKIILSITQSAKTQKNAILVGTQSVFRLLYDYFKVSKNIEFSLWDKQCCLAKIEFFPRFSSLCITKIVMVIGIVDRHRFVTLLTIWITRKTSEISIGGCTSLLRTCMSYLINFIAYRVKKYITYMNYLNNYKLISIRDMYLRST